MSNNRGQLKYRERMLPSSLRWDKKEKKYIDIKCPNIVQQYNASMGGVDLLDSLIALYRIRIRSKKWYHRLVFHFIDMAVVQC